METKVLYMTFKNSLGNSCTISVDDPKQDITEQNIIDFMNLVVQKNIFQPKGYDITTTVSAKIVNANPTEYNLIV